MATRIDAAPARQGWITGSLADPARAIIGPRRDALLLWGAPLVAFLIVQMWLNGWATAGAGATGAWLLVGAVGVLTFAHLVAVVPRAYLNAEVFAAYRRRLTIVPALLIAALVVSPTALIVAGLLAVLWDVHHSAMQNFGFARLYDMKAGNAPALLRATDLRLNWALYVGPLAAGAALATHFADFPRLSGTVLQSLVTLPGVLEARHDGIRAVAIVAYLGVVGWAVADYVHAIRRGYRVPAHKLATLAVSGGVSLLAWGFAPPLVALAAINLYHAVQYFALVWVKEGARMRALGPRAAIVFAGGCTLFGLAYAAVGAGWPGLALAPFIACSLLHFWYDGFVWSIRRKQV